MSLLREIQADLTSPGVSLANILRKAQILAYRLKNEPLKSWVEQELNGYKSIEQLPDFRKTGVIPKGTFSGPLGSWMKNAPIPTFALPEDCRTIAETFYLVDGIATYEQLLEGETGSSLRRPWPADFIAAIVNRNEIYPGYGCVEAWSEIPRSAFVKAVDTVRSKLLQFCLEIEAENPDAGEAPATQMPIPEEKVTNIFNNTIYGNASIANASERFSQSN